MPGDGSKPAARADRSGLSPHMKFPLTWVRQFGKVRGLPFEDQGLGPLPDPIAPCVQGSSVPRRRMHVSTATDSTADPMADARIDVRARLVAVDRELAGLADELVPERVPAHVVSRVLALLGRIERRAGGARLVLSDAAARSGAWKAAGARSPEEHAAKQNGTSIGEAKSDLKASAQLADLPAARDATGSGDLSVAKVKAVAEGASADPSAERSLLDKAASGDLQDVRDEARRVRHRVDERDGRAAERMHRRRSLKTWLTLDGEGHGHWNVPPEYQAWFLAALEPYREQAFRAARDTGQRVPPEALMADALYLLARDTLTDLDLPHPPEPPVHPAGSADPDSASRGHRSGTPTEEAKQAAASMTPGPADAQMSSDPDLFARTHSSDDLGGERKPEGRAHHPAPRPGDEAHEASNGEAASGGGPAAGGDDAGGHVRHSPGGPVPTTEPGTDGAARNSAEPGGTSPTSGDRLAVTEADPSASEPPAGCDRGSILARPSGRGPTGGNRRAPAQLNVHVDYPALRRGFAASDETCEIVGIGPVPVALVRHMAADAILGVILTGQDVTVINSERRYIPAALRRALEARDQECVVPGCHARHHLEIDHVQDFAFGGPTSLANTARLCAAHHRLKTYCGWKLIGGPGRWELVPP